MGTRKENGQRGAALLVAIGILAVLLALALVFFGTSRVELRTAQNAKNSVQSDWLAQGASAMAMATLQSDGVLHPTATSLDHKWKTLYNGLWFLGKDWALNPSASHLPNVRADVLYSTLSGPEAKALWDQDFLYIPREQGNSIANSIDFTGPFLTSFNFADVNAFTIEEQVHQWLGGDNPLSNWGADNNGDGLLDSYWLPLPQDVYFGGLDVNTDGFIDASEGGDGIDNDLDGEIDEADELALFLYWGGRDQRDNDGDSLVDEGDEQRIFVTAPIVQRVWDDSSSNAGDHHWETFTLLQDFTANVNLPVLEAYAGVTVNPALLNVSVAAGSASVDTIDNDYSLLANDSWGYCYNLATAEENAANAARAYHAINLNAYPPLNATIATLGLVPGSNLRVTASGEAVCSLAGRVAVLITDESSRVNLNTASAVSPNDAFSSFNSLPEHTFAFNQGLSPSEYDSRVLPGIGPARAEHISQFRNGYSNGNGAPFSVASDGTNGSRETPSGALEWDMAFAGYGGVDDDGSAFWQTLDGIDNDGDGLVDEFFEGVDDPSEFRLFRPFRNRIAESDDDFSLLDDDELVNEIGEGGDQIFLIRDNFEQIFRHEPFNPGPRVIDQLRDLVTVHSRDANERNRIYSGLNETLGVQGGSSDISGLKLDTNFSSGVNIAQAIRENWFYPRSTLMMHAINVGQYGNPLAIPLLLSDPPIDSPYFTVDDTLADNNPSNLGDPPNFHELGAFARALRVYDRAMFNTPFGELVRYYADPNNPYSSSIAFDGNDRYWLTGDASDNYAVGFDADPELRALQLGASIEDFRDSDHTRTVLTSTMLDHWWQEAVAPAVLPQIVYKVAGVESVRITEFMARPVRRMEAEATVNPVQAGYSINLDPNVFTDASAGVGPDFDFAIDSMAARTGFVVPAGGLAWQRRPVDPANLNPFIGSGTMVSSNAQLIGDTDTAPTIIRPNIVQYEFAPTTQLPPGKYYLTVNTTGTAGVSNSEFLFAVKVGLSSSDGGQSILDDALAYYADPLNPNLVDPVALFGTALHESPIAGRYNMDLQADPVVPGNLPSGWVFLPTTEGPLNAETQLGVTNNRYAGYGGFVGYTVEVPSFQPVGQRLSLYVAVMKSVNNTNELALNFFDFSQEPDHEWVELTNIAETAVDVSNWDLQISPGGSLADGGVFTIPQGTTIAPNGSILLAMNKFDAHVADIAQETAGSAASDNLTALYNSSLLSHTGIALARTVGGAFDFITEPPLPMYDPIASAVAAYSTAVPPNSVPIADSIGAQSMFLRRSDADFLDNDGDGRNDGANLDSAIESSPSGAGSGNLNFNGLATGGTNKAWDRIVQLQSPALSVNSLERLAAVVLGGGFLPNYPEFDIVDNDSDNGLLVNDGIDNDGDGGIDEADEGVEEGRFRRITAGQSVPGSYSATPVAYNVPGFTDREYMTNLDGPPEFKAFVERRYFPGENAVITLYQGAEELGRVVDRVTYNQKDVENRAIHDILDCPYPLAARLDGATAGFWPDNTMGVDFYRSLQRKHPLYAGDMFATSNRWEATDGNYDDWHEGTNRWHYNGTTLVSRLQGASSGFDSIDYAQLYGHGFSGAPLRAKHFQRELMLHQMDFFPLVNPGQEFWGFLTAKVRNRTLGSSGDLLTMPQMILWKYMDYPQAATLTAFPMGLDALPLNGAVGGRSGPLLGNAYPKDIRSVLAETTTDSITLAVGTAGFYPVWPTPEMVRDNPELIIWNLEMNAVTGAPRAWAPVFLYSLDEIDTEQISIIRGILDPPDVRMNRGAYLDPNGIRYPNLPDNYPIQLNFILRNPGILPGFTIPSSIPETVIPRWPIAKRAVMYVATNPISLDPRLAENQLVDSTGRDILNNLNEVADDSIPFITNMPSEALFTWSGDNAVPNGEYDIYVATGNYLDGNRMIGLNNSNQLTEFGRILTRVASDAARNALDAANPPIFYEFGGNVQPSTPMELRVDVAVFTDRNGNGRCWNNQLAGPVRGNFETTDLVGLRRGLEPNSNGYETYVHFGTVRVENNYLGVLVRNWSEGGKVNRISRVILSPRRHTPGRININTAITTLRPDGTDVAVFNPLFGIPGVLGPYSAGTGFVARPYADVNPIDLKADLLLANPLDGLDSVARRAYHLVAGEDPFDGEGPVTPDPLGETGILQARGKRDNNGVFEFRPDGRYYLFPSELVARGDLDAYARMDRLELYPRVLSPNAPTLGGSEDVVTGNEILASQFEETKERFSRMAAMVTTRSDVFEIVVTAQAGFATDENGDGVADWTGDEFVVLGEKKLRTVYERP